MRIVALPMSSGLWSATPSARTVQGVLPSFASISAASPTPNSHSPSRRTPSESGCGLQLEPVALHGILGIDRDGASSVRRTCAGFRGS